MSLTSEQARVQYTVTTSPQSFAIPFVILTTADVAVYKTVAGVDTQIYPSITGAGTNPSTAQVTGITGLVGATLTIVRNAPITQPSTYVENDRFPARTHEQNMDRLTMLIQQVDEKVDRSIRVPLTSSASMEAQLLSRKNRMVGFDNVGNLNLVDPVASIIHFSSGTGIEAGNMVALRAASVSGFASGRSAGLLGFHSLGDGGQGAYVYDSTSVETDNGGTIIAPNVGAGRWKRMFSGAIDVKWFGTKGDGVTDDTASIQAAISAMSSGGELFFPIGTYLVSSQLILSNTIGFRITGASTRLSKIIAGATITGGAVLKVFNSQLGVIQSLSLFAEGLADYGLWFDTDNTIPVSNVTCINVEVNRAAVKGVRLASSIVSNFQVDFCTFIGCSLYGSPKNVSIESTNSLEHCFYNCQFAASGASVPDWNVYCERGGFKVFGGAGTAAVEYDFFQGQGSRIEIRGYYSESQRIWYGDFIATYFYPIVFDGITHNVNTAGAVYAFYSDIGGCYLKVTNCRIGGDFYLNGVPTEFRADSNRFTPGKGFVGNTAALAVLTGTDGVGRNVFGQVLVSKLVTTTGVSGAIAVDALTADVLQIALVGNVTVGAPSNTKSGQRITFVFYQDSAGGYTVAWNAIFRVTWSDTGNVTNRFSSISFRFTGTVWVQEGAQSPYN